MSAVDIPADATRTDEDDWKWSEFADEEPGPGSYGAYAIDMEKEPAALHFCGRDLDLLGVDYPGWKNS